MASTPNPSALAPLKPIRRERDATRSGRSVQVQEPNVPSQETIGTGRDGKERVAKVFQLSSFERNFNVENFIGEISEKLITSSKANTGALDPLPFISSFSPALDHLLALQKSVSRKTKDLEGEVRAAERSCEGRLREIDGGFETIGSSFTALETKITGVGRTAVRIGEQMESLHNLRSVAQSASLILSYYLSLAQPPAPVTTPQVDAGGNPQAEEPPQTPLDALFATRTSREGRARLAIILRRLSTLAKDVVENASAAAANAQDNARDDEEDKERLAKLRADADKAIRIRDAIEKYAERFEKECLRLFDRSYRKGDVRMMAHCAKILQDFNQCTSCIQMYVNQHDFFISKDKVLEEASGLNSDGTSRTDSAPVEDIWANLNDPNQAAPTAEPGLTALSKEIRSTVDQEAQIIQAVFPMKEDVMRVFLQRVFAQVIQQHLETLFARAAVLGTLALLRMLRLTHSQCSVLIEDLKQYDFSGFGGEANATVSVTTDRRTGVSTTVTLASMLDSAMEEMFSQYIEGGRYLELEGKWMAIAYKDLAHKYQRFHETQIKSKPGNFLDRVVDKLSTTGGGSGVAPAAPSTTSSATSAAAAWLHRYGGNALTGVTGSKDVTRAATPAQSGASSPIAAKHPSGQHGLNGSEGLNQEDGVVKLEVVERFLRIHAEAVGRVVELSVGGETAQNASKLAKLLADDVGGDYLELALESASSKLEGQDRAEPDLTILAQIHQVDLALHLWQTYYSTVLVPLVSSNPAVRRDALKWNANTVTRVEGKVNTLVLRFLDASVAWLSILLKRQKNSDFKPKDEEMSFARTTTEPCTLCCSYLERLNEAGHKAFTGKNAEAFFTELGVEFHALLLDHYKRFPVNPTGGLMLTKDLATYQDSIKTFGIPLLNDRFDMLRQLGNSFIVQSDVLKSYLTEGHLGRIDARLLRPYLQQRSDWSTFAKQFGEEEAFVEKTEQDVVAATTSGLLKASRYSVGIGAAGMSKLKDMLKAVDDHAFGEVPSQQYRTPGAHQGLNRAPSYRQPPSTQGFFVP